MNGFIVSEKDWENMTPAQQGWLTYEAVQNMNNRVVKLEKRSLTDKACAAAGGLIGGFLAYLGLGWRS